MSLPDDDRIPVRLALNLHSTGMTWRQVGVALANMRRRPVPYLAESVCAAVSRWKGVL